MKIVDVTVIPFKVQVNRYENGKALPGLQATQTLARIVTDEGAEGFCFGGHGHGEQDGLLPDAQASIVHRIKPMLIGQDPFDREKLWQWMWAAKTPENVMSVVDIALWDLLGRVTGLPVHKLLGGCREKVLAYASTYPNMGSPEDYAEHAAACQRQGYRAYKIHPYYYWHPATGEAVPGRPSHIAWDIEVCRAVRARVGDQMVLMFDPWGTYHVYEDALAVGRELERLNFHWYEHPMPEHRIEPYVRLARELTIPICSPEIVEGMLFSRADWIQRGASDISRIDVLRGGITGARKMATVCEAYGLRCELHMSGFGNLQVLGATSEDTCEYYERGLLAPGVDYEAPLLYLKEPCDALDDDGFVRVPTHPGLGYQIVWDYIEANRSAPL
ncbi:MAG TPA: enolase C-terminal domain-like protein [Chloroflexota bacterium]|nr:enolase C-terminal domain-like protein [Chloroflexota bacterium]